MSRLFNQIQPLVNAQIEVRRAVFLVKEDACGNEHDLDVSPEKVDLHARNAIEYLREFRRKTRHLRTPRK
jgi:hypothetical protein